MTPRPAPTALAAAVVTALLAALLVVVTPTTAAAAPRPGNDFPRMPAACASAAEKIPSQPVVCRLNGHDRQRPTVVLWGDSHAWMLIPALEAAVAERRVNLVAVVMGSCPPMDNQVRAGAPVPACFHSNRLALDLTRRLKASGQPYRIVLASSWQRYVRALAVGDDTSYVGVMAEAMSEGMPRLAASLRSMGARVEVVGEVATVPPRHRVCAGGENPYACSLPRTASVPGEVPTRTWLGSALRPVLGPRTPIDVNPTFCNDRVCLGRVGAVRTWFDDLHLSATRSAGLASYFEEMVDSLSMVDPGEPDAGCDLLGIPVPC